jgi:hypothetical protein
MEDLGFDGNGHVLAFIAGSGSGGNVIQVDPLAGTQSALVPNGLFSGTTLVVDGGTVHGGIIYVDAYDPTGAMASQLVSFDPMNPVPSTVTTGDQLGVVGGVTVFSATGGGAAAAPSALSGGVLHGAAAALVHAGRPEHSDPSSAGTSLSSPQAAIPLQLTVNLQPVAAALSAATMPMAATDSVFANWDAGVLKQACLADPILSGMASGLST